MALNSENFEEKIVTKMGYIIGFSLFVSLATWFCGLTLFESLMVFYLNSILIAFMVSIKEWLLR